MILDIVSSGSVRDREVPLLPVRTRTDPYGFRTDSVRDYYQDVGFVGQKHRLYACRKNHNFCKNNHFLAAFLQAEGVRCCGLRRPCPGPWPWRARGARGPPGGWDRGRRKSRRMCGSVSRPPQWGRTEVYAAGSCVYMYAALSAARVPSLPRLGSYYAWLHGT
jgi:hypothetical protein